MNGNQAPGKSIPARHQLGCVLPVIGKRQLHGARGVLLAVCCAFALNACSQQSTPSQTEGKNMTEPKKEVVYFDVAVFSYIERPIFDVYLNGEFVGDGGGGGGLMTGVSVILGPQTITWRLDGVDAQGKPFSDNGNTVKAANQPILLHPEKDKHYLGIHIYPDNTVEFIPTTYWPERTEKGLAIDQQQEAQHGR